MESVSFWPYKPGVDEDSCQHKAEDAGSNPVTPTRSSQCSLVTLPSDTPERAMEPAAPGSTAYRSTQPQYPTKEGSGSFGDQPGAGRARQRRRRQEGA